MNRITSLDNIIRKVGPGEDLTPGEDETDVLYDPKKKRVVDSANIFNRSRIQHYFVTPERSVRYVAPPLKLRSQSNSNEVLEVNVICHVGCPLGHEKKVIQELAKSREPADMLDRVITDASEAYNREHIEGRSRDPILNLFDVRDQWEIYVGDYIAKRIGFQADVTLEVPANIETIQFVEDINVFVHDYDDEELYLGLQVNLEVMDEGRRQAIFNLGQSQKLYDQIRKQIREWVPDNYNIREFCDGAVKKQEIRELIDEAAYGFGRKAGFLKCKLKVPFELPDLSALIRHQHACEPKGLQPGNNVQVKHVVGLNLENVALFLKSRIKSVPAWIKEEMQRITESTVLECDVSSFIHLFDSAVRNPVRAELEAAAEKCGLALKTYVAEPEFDFDVMQAVEIKEEIRTYAKDCDEQLTISINALLEIPLHLRGRAVSSPTVKPISLAETIVEGVKQYLQDGCGIDQFVLEQEKVSGEIREVLDRAAQEFGHSVIRADVRLQAPFSIPEPVRIEHRHEYEIAAWPRGIPIKHRFVMSLESVADYRKAAIVNPQEWGIATLEKVAQQELLDCDYKAVVADFDTELNERIKEKLAAAAKQAGFQIRTYHADLELRSQLPQAVDCKEQIHVHVHDCDDAVTVGMDARFLVADPAEALKSEALKHTLQEALVDKLRDSARSYSLNRFHGSWASVRQELAEESAVVASQYGRLVDYCNFDYSLPFELPEFDIVVYRHKCKIQNWDEPIDVEHTVLLEIVDVAAYRRSNQTDISRWLRSTLEGITQKHLFDCNFIEVVTKFRSELEPAIKKEMKLAADKIGIGLKQFSSVPDVEATRLQREGFSCPIGERSFSISDSREPVRLTLDIRGKVTDVSKITEHLTPNVNLKDLFEECAVAAAEDVLHETTSKAFYFSFEDPVRKQIVGKVKRDLEEKYGVETSRVTAQQTDTTTTVRLRELSKARPSIEVEARPIDGPSVKFWLTFRILAVDEAYWHVFLSGARLKPDGTPDVAGEVEDIREFVGRVVYETLDHSLPMEALLFERSLVRERLKEVIWGGTKASEALGRREGVASAVASRYGVVVEIDSFKRGDAEHEKLRRERTVKRLQDSGREEDSDIEHIRETIRKLQDKERELVLADTTDDELKPVRAEIESLRQRIDNPKEIEDAVKPQLPKIAAKRSAKPPDALTSFLLSEERPRLESDNNDRNNEDIDAGGDLIGPDDS